MKKGIKAVLVLAACCAAAQDSANWNTGTGNWGKAANWDCVIGGVSTNCVPGAGFVVTQVGGDITLDVNANIGWLMGSAGSLTLNNTSLTATNSLGIQMTGGIVNLSNGAVVNGFLLTDTLQVQSSAVNGSVEASNANISNSVLGSLLIVNQLTAANSNFGSNSNLTILQASSISNSVIGGQFGVNSGGSLTVDRASTINSTQAAVSSGSLTLQGGSTWNASTSPFSVGVAPGSASLDVTGTGSVLNIANTALELGELSNSTVTVEHGGSIAATGAQGNIFVGLGVVFPTASQMIVNSAGNVSAQDIVVTGSTGGSTALLSISDSPSSVTANGVLRVNMGGEVNAANQGSLTANSLSLISGSVTIDSGATFTLTSDTAALVGSQGVGSVTFQGGGTGSGSGELVLGVQAGSTGNLTITDLGSAWHGESSVSIGEKGVGTATVLTGGLLETGADANGLSGSIGTQSSGVGTATVQGGDWQAGGKVQIGAAGTGTLSLLQSGTVESEDAKLGVSAGAIGNVSVIDAGSKWTLSGDLTVGSAGNGTLSIANGGHVGNQDAIIGELAGSSSSASVSGIGSRWENSGKLTVGQNGAGLLSITGGGVVTNVDAVLGDKRGSSGTVTVTGLGSSWQNSGILTIGGDGAANLTIDAGNVTGGGGAMGSNFSPVQVTITNHGALNLLGDVTIGGAASTTFTVENGGTFDSGNAATVGGSGGDSTVTVTGADSAWTLHGTGALTLDDKGSLFVMDGGTVTAGTLTLLPGSLLNGQDGNIIGSVVNQGGTMTAGDATGTMTITGDYTQTSGGLLFEIDGLGTTQYDRLMISGLADFSGGSIDVQFGDGFLPAAGESFDLITANLGLTLTDVTFGVIGLPAGEQFFDTVGPNGFAVRFDPQSVPESGTVILFALGLAFVAQARYLRRRSTGSRATKA